MWGSIGTIINSHMEDAIIRKPSERLSGQGQSRGKRTGYLYRLDRGFSGSIQPVCSISETRLELPDGVLAKGCAGATVVDYWGALKFSFRMRTPG